MILRRIASALKRQDWATVLIEFILVILGVLIALQVNNWNEARIDKRVEQEAALRLHAELLANIDDAEEPTTVPMTTHYEPRCADRVCCLWGARQTACTRS